jgi:hypothetical protein
LSYAAGLHAAGSLSALAGVILAAAVVRSALGVDPPTTLATSMNLLEEWASTFRCRCAREAIAAVDATIHCSATYATQSKLATHPACSSS